MALASLSALLGNPSEVVHGRVLVGLDHCHCPRWRRCLEFLQKSFTGGSLLVLNTVVVVGGVVVVVVVVGIVGGDDDDDDGI
jgi:hypothetical protein